MEGVRPESKFVHVNGLNIHYLDWGGGATRTLILQHGLTSNAHYWDHIAAKLADEFRVIAFDTRGCGDSDWAKTGYAVQTYASDVVEIARALGAIPFVFCGHSQGSRAGIPLGAYWGQFITHLVLGDYGPMPDQSEEGKRVARRRMQRSGERPRGFRSPEEAFEWFQEQEPERQPDELYRRIKYELRLNWAGKLVWRADPEIFWLTGSTGLKEGPFLWDCLARISCKTMVLRGSQSDVLDGAQAKRMASLIPHGILREVPETGHGLFIEQPERCIEILKEFLIS
ncbi:MAG: alpha/beta hydrolase [Chloroflexi bacterium]|nr:alpha/beta hydrolase [Chloroflexota bacterium]